MLGLHIRPPPVGCIDRRALAGDLTVHLPKDMSNGTQERHGTNPQHSPTLLIALVLEHVEGVSCEGDLDGDEWVVSLSCGGLQVA